MSNNQHIYKPYLSNRLKTSKSIHKTILFIFWVVLPLVVTGFVLDMFVPIGKVKAQGQLDAQVTVDPPDQNLPQPISLTVAPATAYLKVGPGNTALHSITLTNDGTYPIRVTPKLVSFDADGKTGQPVLKETHHFPYLDEDKTSFQPLNLQPNQTAQLTLHISVPPQAEKLEYPLTVLFAAEPAADHANGGLNEGQGISSPTKIESTQSSTRLAGTIGSNLIVLITSETEPQPHLRITDWQSWPVVDSFGEITVRPIIQNDSYAASVASGSAVIKDWRGKAVASFLIEPTVILGKSSRLITPSQEKINTQQANAATQQANMATQQTSAFTYSSPFMIGPYTAEITLVHDQTNGTAAQISHTTIIALPFSLILAGLFAASGWWLYVQIQRKRLPF